MLKLRYLGNAATEYDPKTGKSIVGKYEVFHDEKVIGVIDLGPTTVVERSEFFAKLCKIGLLQAESD